MKARTGFESTICLAISRVVFRGLVVVMMAPRDITARHTMGKKIEFGDNSMMTWPFRMPMSDRYEATEFTARHSSGKVRWRPVEASMKAILPAWARDDMTVVTSTEWFCGSGMGFRLL